MIDYYDPKRVSIEEGIDMIPTSIDFTLSLSLRVLRLNKDNKNRVIRLAEINDETLVSSVLLRKYIEELQ